MPLFLWGCQEDIVTPKGPARLVVEGWVTDQEGPFQVSLSETADFGARGSTPRVTGAQVSIEDDQGNNYLLDQEVEPGFYQTNFDSLAGVVDRSYRLQIMTPDGEQYASSWELLSPVPPIDTLTTPFNPFIGGLTTFNPFSLSIFVNYTDPLGKGNFYRWKIYDDTVLFSGPKSLLLADDRIEDGNRRSLELNFIVNVNDPPRIMIRVEQMSLSEGAYDFLSLLKSQILDLGEPFGVAPAPILGNIFNQNDPDQMILGYFGASSVTSKEIEIRLRQ